MVYYRPLTVDVQGHQVLMGAIYKCDIETNYWHTLIVSSLANGQYCAIHK